MCIRSESRFPKGGYNPNLTLLGEFLPAGRDADAVNSPETISIKPCTTGSAIGCILLKTGDFFFFKGRGIDGKLYGWHIAEFGTLAHCQRIQLCLYQAMDKQVMNNSC